MRYVLCLKSVTTYVWLYNLIYGWDRTSAYIGAAGGRYPSICDLTQRINVPLLCDKYIFPIFLYSINTLETRTKK